MFSGLLLIPGITLDGLKTDCSASEKPLSRLPSSASVPMWIKGKSLCARALDALPGLEAERPHTRSFTALLWLSACEP